MGDKLVAINCVRCGRGLAIWHEHTWKKLLIEAGIGGVICSPCLNEMGLL